MRSGHKNSLAILFIFLICFSLNTYSDSSESEKGEIEVPKLKVRIEKIGEGEQEKIPVKETQRPAKKRRISSQSQKRSFNRFVFSRFSFGGSVVMDSQGGVGGATNLGWTPLLFINESFWLKAQLGVGGFNLFNEKTFFSFDGLGAIVLSGIRPFLFELGAGAQYWSIKKGFLPQARGAIGYRFQGKDNLIQSVQISYSRLFDKLVNVNMVTASLGFRF